MKKFKYTTKFNTVVHASSDIASFKISEASLEPLRELIPDSVSFDRNIDLLGVAFNAAVANKLNIREVTLFPMIQNAEDLLMGAPSEAIDKQLKELGIKTLKKEK